MPVIVASRCLPAVGNVSLEWRSQAAVAPCAIFIPPSVFEGLCMQPRQLRVGDLVDDYCPRERRLSNHAIVALVGDDIRQVRCTTCDAEHEYKGGKLPASRRKKAAAVPAALAPARDVAAPPPVSDEPAPAGPTAPAPIAASPAAEPEPAAAPEDAQPQPPSPHAEISLHRRLIRATLPRIESDTPARPIPEFTMHRAAAGHGSRHGKPFRHGQGGGQHRHAKGGFGQQQRHGQGEANGNTFGPPRGGQGQRGGQGGHRGHGGPGGPGGPGNPQAQRHPRHGFGRGPKKH
jgi:hypothetical protein